jgi:hypothetical protein
MKNKGIAKMLIERRQFVRPPGTLASYPAPGTDWQDCQEKERAALNVPVRQM